MRFQISWSKFYVSLLLSLSIQTESNASPGNSGTRAIRIFETLENNSLSICQEHLFQNIRTSCAGRLEIRSSFLGGAQTKNGLIIISQSLISKSDDDELAFIISHEIAHNILRHKGSTVTNELQADRWATKLMINSGFDPSAAARVLRRGDINWFLAFPFSLFSHPLSGRRIREVTSASQNWHSLRAETSKPSTVSVRPLMHDNP